MLMGVCFLWGSAWPLMKIALGELSPWTFRTLCLTCGGIGLLGAAKANGQRLSIPREEMIPLLVVSLLNMTGWNMFSAYGLLYMSAGRGVIIAYTMPIWASILAVLVLGERLTRERLLALFLGITGLVILIGPDILRVGNTPLGPIFMLGAACSWAAGTVMMKRFPWNMDTLVLAGWQFVFGCIPVVIGALLIDPMTSILQLTWKGGLATAYVAIIGISVGWWVWFKVVKILPANVASTGTVASPVIGVISNALIMGEPIGFQEIAALACVVMALAIMFIGFEGFRRLTAWKR